MAAALDDAPGFRRRIRITPAPGHVTAALEDDFHRMAVTIAHDGAVATAVAADMARVPWTICGGAVQTVRQTFTGVALAAFHQAGGRTLNCTHLHDLAIWAAAHAHDSAPLVWDVLVSDPVAGVSHAELRRDGAAILGWTIRDGRIVTPEALRGARLDELREWIGTLDPAGQEAARLLRWATMISHGRVGRLRDQYDPALFTGRCHTFQPENAGRAERLPTRRDFSRGDARPLDP